MTSIQLRAVPGSNTSRLRIDASWLAACVLGFSLAFIVDQLLPKGADGLPPISVSVGVAVGLLARIPGRLFPPATALMIVIALTTVGLAGWHGGATMSALTQLVACVATAIMLRHWKVRRIRNLTDLGLLLAIGMAGTFGAAMVGAALDGFVGDFGWPTVDWLTWWLARVCGIALLAPGIMAAVRPSHITRQRLIESIVVGVIGAGLLAAVFLAKYDTAVAAWSVQYLLIPLFLWLALRFGLSAVAAGLVIVDVVALIATAHDLGPYGSSSPTGASIVVLQLSMVITGLAIYATAINEHRRRATQERLSATSGVVDSLLLNSDASISVKEYDESGVGRYRLVNPRFAQSVNRPIPHVVGSTDEQLFDLTYARSARAEDQVVLDSRASQVFVSRRPGNPNLAGGGGQILLITKFPIADAQGRMSSVGSVALDITDHRRRERMMRLTFDQSPIPMARLAWRDGRAGEVLDANRSLADLLGVPVADVIGSSLDRFVHPDERGIELVVAFPDPSAPQRREVRLEVGGEPETWVVVTAAVVEADEDDGLDEAFALVTLEDVTARRMAEQTLTHQALHDALTGVLNRYALLDRLQAALNRLWRDSSYVAVLFADLDGFKHLNDTLGHRAGDQVLVSVSERLRAVMRPHDTVARLGGDEFVLVCQDLRSPGQASVIGERIRSALRAPFVLDGREYGLTVSIGITTTTDPEARAEDLLRRADLAMYRAKDAGRNRVEYYVDELETRAVAHVESTEALRRAIAEDRICVHYQPIVDLATRKTIGVEALVRLIAEDGSLVRPAEFIDVAETSGLVVPLGERVLDFALDQLAKWRDAGSAMTMSINVSPRQLAAAGFAPAVFERLLALGLPPDCLTLEVTEAAVVDATGPTLLTLRRLRSYGVHVGIDDFGTGYSSLTTLKYLPADMLKIDRSFVDGLGSDPQDSAIVAAVIKVAHDLSHVVIAEGVEDAAQESALAAMGCDMVQGFRYGKPVAAAALDSEGMRSARR